LALVGSAAGGLSPSSLLKQTRNGQRCLGGTATEQRRVLRAPLFKDTCA
jgi:hypothetical protein